MVSATSSLSNAYAGGIGGHVPSSPITNCYNTGMVSATSTSSRAYAGGIIGYSLSLTITNCYNTGAVSVTSSSLSDAYAGGIIGYTSSSLITNCYYLKDQRYLQGSLAADTLCGYGDPIVDGNDTSNRSVTFPDQRSSTAKTLIEMIPSFGAAANGSIYFTGMTNIMGGWNFDTVWIVDVSPSPINGGLPTLKPHIAYFTVSGQITSDGKGTANMRIIYTIGGGSPQTAVTDANGNYTITAQIGKMVRITNFELTGYVVRATLPLPYVGDSTANFTWTPDSGLNTQKPKGDGIDLGIILIMVVVGAVAGGLIGAGYFLVYKKR
jgi:hypothetical protein